MHVDTPKPLRVTIENGQARAIFNSKELAQFVRTTQEPLLVMEDESGNKSAISVDLIREFLQSSDADTLDIQSPHPRSVSQQLPLCG